MTKCESYDLTDWGQPFEKAVRDIPKLPDKGVLIRVSAAGLCHSDLHIKKGFMDMGERGKLTFAQRGAELPLTLGHEIAGIVEAAGPAVTDVQPGQSVVVFPWIGCRDCLACDEDRESDCAAMQIIGIHRNGGFATHVVVEDEKFLVDIDGLDPAIAAPYACSGITVYNGLLKAGLTRPDEWLAVLGTGGLGLNAIAIARAMGFDNIIALDIDDAKLIFAREMGADKTLNSSAGEAVADALRSATDNKLFAVLDTFGSAQTGALAVSALAKTGRYVVVGQHGGDFKMPQIWLPQKAMTVRGSHVGNSGHLRTLIDLYRQGRLKAIPVEVRPLTDVNNAIADLENGRVHGRIVFDPTKGV